MLSACLVDQSAYLARRAELTDDDGDGFSELEGDCDDGDAAIAPNAVEVCDAVDDDCDGTVDGPDVTGADWYPDSDGDGYGAGDPVVTCSPAAGMVQVGGDCGDTDPAMFPGAPERCNAVDDDCDGVVDEVDQVETLDWYPDEDGDGWGTGTPIASCAAPAGCVLADGDCDDADADAHPEATEVCNGVDDDCNGATDDAPAVTWYLDRDGDGYGDDASPYLVCAPPPGYAAVGGDCADDDATRNPDATEACEDGVDSDCDGHDATCGIPTGAADVDDVSATFTGTSGEAYVARTVATAGDLDGDGDDELIVSRPGYNSLRGEVRVIPGSADLYLGDHALASTGAALGGLSAGGAFGVAVSAGEDTDGDGVDDVLVGAENHAYLFTDGAALLTTDRTTDDAATQMSISPADAGFGLAVALLGDLDGDGFGDWIVGDYAWSDSGAAFLYYGGGVSGDLDTSAASTLVGDRADAQAGQEVARLGDVDGDGMVDFGVGDNVVTGGETARSHAYLYVGASGRIDSGALTDAALAYAGMPTDSTFAEIVGVGDLNADGFDDVAFGAAGATNAAGIVYVVLGSASLTAGVEIADAADLTWSGATAGLGLGASIAGPGDLTGDGFPELAAQTERTDTDGPHLYLLPGRAALAGAYTTADATMDLEGGNTEVEGEGIATRLDANGDGAVDLLTSAWSDSTAQGEAWLIYGSAP